MKWSRTLILFDKGNIAKSADWKTVHDSYVRAITQIDFPEGSGKLALRRSVKLANGQWNRNGVLYLKRRFFDYMVGVENWRAEADFDLGRNRPPVEITLYPGMQPYREPISSEFGGFDLVTKAPGGMDVAIEWETGNISSSHRSMNKLAIALASGKLDAAVLIVPSRDLYKQLTDRIGNIGELSGYLQMWMGLGASVAVGLLAITVVEHDVLTDDPSFPYLPVGKDGRAAEGRSKRK